jgi:hypothetical protein
MPRCQSELSAVYERPPIEEEPLTALDPELDEAGDHQQFTASHIVRQQDRPVSQHYDRRDTGWEIRPLLSI